MKSETKQYPSQKARKEIWVDKSLIPRLEAIAVDMGEPTRPLKAVIESLVGGYEMCSNLNNKEQQ